MAGIDDGKVAYRVIQALQAMSRGEADAVEIRGSVLDEEVARTVVAAFLEGFELDVVFTDLDGGFQVCVRNPPGRTISLDL
jgi:hypothetical protein